MESVNGDEERGMGRLVRIELENFKSYAGSQTIGPFRDFTAVIGPNGAGKSNLMDAISFVLGVQSRHLRSQKLEDLVFSACVLRVPVRRRCHRASGGSASRRRAMVKVVYQVGKNEVEGMDAGEELHFSRVISAGGASSYRLNDKEVPWKKYEEKLQDIGVLVKARNFLVFQASVSSLALPTSSIILRNTLCFDARAAHIVDNSPQHNASAILQGDVESIAARSPKELTELFEQISGSDALKKEYDAYKREMESAEQEALYRSVKAQAMHATDRRHAQYAAQDIVHALYMWECRRGFVPVTSLAAERFEEKQAELEAIRREYFLVQLFHLHKDVDESEHNLKLMAEELDGVQEKEQEVEQELKGQKKELAVLNKHLSKAEAEAEKARRKLAELGPTSIKILLLHMYMQNSCHLHVSCRCVSLHGLMQLREEVRALERQVADCQKAATEMKTDKQKQDEHIAGLVEDIEEAKEKEAQLARRIESEGQHEQLSAGRMKEYETLKAEARRTTQAKRDELEGARREVAAATATLDAAEAELSALQQRLSNIKENQQQYTQRRTAMDATVRTAQDEHARVEAEMKELSDKEERDREQAQRLEAELADVDERLRDARAGRRETNHEVRGRLSALCKPAQRRYNEAVATAAGRHMDAIVVDTRATGFECVRHLRAHRLGAASFIPLDGIRPAPVGERLRALGPQFRLAIDVIQCDDDIRPAVAFAVGNTVVAESLNDARDLRFRRNEQVKCVTIQGAVITKAGNITGGTTSRDNSSAHRWNEQEVQELKKRREDLRLELASLNRSHRHESALSELRTRLQGLRNRQSYSKADMQVCDDKLSSLNKQEKLITAQVEASRKASTKAKDALSSLEKGVAKLESKLQKAEDAIFADFLKEVGVSSVRDFEEGPMRAVRGLTRERLRLTQHRAKLEAQLEYERGRDFQKPLDKITAKAAAKRAAAVEAEKKGADLKEKEERPRLSMKHIDGACTLVARMYAQTLMRKAEELDGVVKERKEAAGAKEKEVRAVQSERQKRAKERASIGKKTTAEETALERLRARLHEVLQRAAVEEVDLPMKDQPEDADGDRSTPLPLPQEAMSEASGSTHSRSRQLSADTSQSQQESGPHFSQAESRTVQKDKEATARVDLDQLKKHRRVSSAHELQEEKLKESGASFEAAKGRSKTAAQKFDDIKDRRRDLFEDAFNHIAKELVVIYKELTRSSKHPLGGQASLSLDDQEEPYNGGIKFSAMPPGKRLRDMDQLSGGERTVAALALLFAIHSYRPAPFFVMDEIDAALDNINVKKVCHFIESRAAQGAFQSIVISLKDMFYERSEALVGICRDASTNRQGADATAQVELTDADAGPDAVRRQRKRVVDFTFNGNHINIKTTGIYQPVAEMRCARIASAGMKNGHRTKQPGCAEAARANGRGQTWIHDLDSCHKCRPHFTAAPRGGFVPKQHTSPPFVVATVDWMACFAAGDRHRRECSTWVLSRSFLQTL
ncbi:structural maintenance of chromosomes 1 protein [Tribonema minus]|uniref:Structural maintenance of chromosomes protein n=1 Tax=Tribonema minus TaxID=303371 RepID=A0A835ZAW7_9STRA|nr:structural maintenance of chromosomes 1 protein [Tribonema minus]